MKKLLIVDDEPVVLSFVTMVAESLQYEVVRAKDGVDALLAYTDAPGIDALITDIRMPGINGFQLAASLRQQNPELPILFISGFSEEWEQSGLDADPRIHFLAKPFSPQQLGSGLMLLFISGPSGD